MGKDCRVVRFPGWQHTAGLLSRTLNSTGFGTENWKYAQFNADFSSSDKQSIDRMHAVIKKLENLTRPKPSDLNIRIETPVMPDWGRKPTVNVNKPKRVRKPFVPPTPLFVPKFKLTESGNNELPKSIDNILNQIVEAKILYDCTFNSIKNGFSLEVCEEN